MKLILVAALAATLLQHPIEETFVRGETLDYSVSWMKVTGGTARMTISPLDDERYRITSVVRSGGGIGRLFRIRDEIETIVSRAEFSTLRYTKRLDERGDKMEEKTVVEDGIATRTRKKVKKIPVPFPVLDPFSVIYHVRRLDLTPGNSWEFTLIADGKVYGVHARVMRRETIQTPAGTFKTVMVEPQMISGGVTREERLFIWYSDDERRLPVRIRTEVKFGAVTANLTAASEGVSSTNPPAMPQ